MLRIIGITFVIWVLLSIFTLAVFLLVQLQGHKKYSGDTEFFTLKEDE